MVRYIYQKKIRKSIKSRASKIKMEEQKSITKTFYIPIEIIDRELGGALLLSAYAVSKGWKVVLGGKQAIFNNMSRFKDLPGVFFLKSIVPGEVFKQKEIMSYGHRVVSLDVEGLVPSNGDSGVRLRYSDDSIALTDILFFWGQDHFNSVYNVYPQIKEKSVISGSPIIDEMLIRGKKAKERRKNSKRKQVLIGTSCGYANHINGIEFSKKMTKDAHGENVDSEQDLAFKYEAELDTIIFEYWKEAVPKIAEEVKGCDIVLRPHPSENKDFWRNHVKKYDNIRINEGGSILDEMLKSDFYVHFNSTSAITSMILDLPTYMLLPKMKKELFDRIAFVKDLSITVENTDILVDKLKSAVEGQGQENLDVNIDNYCENLKDPDLDSSKLIVDKFDEIYNFVQTKAKIKRQGFKEGLIVKLKKLKFFILWSLGIVCDLFNVKARDRFPPRNSYKNSNAKQPNTSLSRVVNLLEELVGEERFEEINIEKKARNLFVISYGENK